MDNVLVRVINKDKQGATVQSLDGRIAKKFEWKEFDLCFKPTETKNIYEMILSEDVDAEVEKVLARHRWITPNFPMILMIINKQKKGVFPEFAEISFLGSVVQEYQEKFGLSMMDFVDDINTMKEILQASLINP